MITSMTEAEFTVEMQRLMRVYGENNYPAERVEIIWDRFKRMPLQLFHKVVLRIIADWVHKTPPSASVMQEYALPEFKALNEMNRPARSFQEMAQQRRRTPWPASIESIMLQIEDGRYRRFEREFNSSLSFVRLSEQDAWTLYECFVEKDFKNEKVQRILAGRSDRLVLRSLSNVAQINAAPFNKLLSPLPPDGSDGNSNGAA